MDLVLQKTMQSLEAALRYNPTSLELMTSLAEVYVRLGRIDQRTMELCETVLAQEVDNLLLQQAQSMGMLLKQSTQFEQMLSQGEPLPDEAALTGAIAILDEFLGQSPSCKEAWFAWTRLKLLVGQLTDATSGLEALACNGETAADTQLTQTLDHTFRRDDLAPAELSALIAMFDRLGATARLLPQLEAIYDAGHHNLGPALLDLYLKRFSPERVTEVPDALRERLLMLLLDHANPETLNLWLRTGVRHGWEVTKPTKRYARTMIDQGQLDEAFTLLKRLPLDAEVKRLLNEIAEAYERRDAIEPAVTVLRHINDHDLQAEVDPQEQERVLAREAEISIGDLMLKNGRPHDALARYVSALCLNPQIDIMLLRQIDQLIETTPTLEVAPLLELGRHFRAEGDRPKALFYLNKANDLERDNQTVLEEMEGLFEEILTENPDLTQLRLELGRLYLATNRLDRAQTMLEAAEQNTTLAIPARQMMARLHLKQGHYTEALDKYRTTRPETDDLESLYLIQSEFSRRQDWRSAHLALDMILKVDPFYRDASERFRLLEDRLGKLQQPAEVVVDTKMKELIGDMAVGRYQYIARLGSGGMGVVHKVFDLRNQQVVAMKILRDTLSGSSKALDRFFREARIAATLRHRHIVSILDYNISNISGQSFIVMEYVDGPSLREMIDRQFKDTTAITFDYITEILYYTVQMCEALEAAHAQGIIHRDIKPDNVMITAQGDVKITDFGIVHVEAATFTPTGAMLGTPRYMSPEQVTGGKIDGRGDLYSLGIVLYEALVGSPPFTIGDVAYQQVHNPPPPPRELCPMIPQTCADLILKCLAKKPDERYAGAGELKQELARLLADLGGCQKYQGATSLEEPTGLGLDAELDLH